MTDPEKLGSKKRIMPDAHTRGEQAKATDPKNSAWVSANAGSGKTYVLAARVIRLLLEGVAPSRLLCLTFTKAAAAEMTNRVFETLSQWPIMAKDELKSAIEALTGKMPDDAQLLRARQLFALALDTPGGLKIQTIHAFCQALLHQFPLEANISGNFSLADDVIEALLINQARRQIILASIGKRPGYGRAGPGRAEVGSEQMIAELAKAFDVMRGFASDEAIEKALGELIAKRARFSAFVKDGAEAAMAPAFTHFGFEPDHTAQALMDEFYTDQAFYDYVRDRLFDYTDNYKNRPKLLDELAALLGADDLQARFEQKKAILLTAKGEARKWLVSEAFTKGLDGLEAFLRAEQEKLLFQLDRIKTLQALQASSALFFVGEMILQAYEALKQARGVLDYDDLITKAELLLTRNHIAQWVQYKLDQGIDHLLIDEAQDTSPAQWKIVNALCEEFFAGEGTDRDKTGHRRTLFVVGDEKQSIYSFQGADIKTFRDEAHNLRRRAQGAQKDFVEPRLNLSFRSTAEVLSAVDKVFESPANRRGLGFDDEIPVHSAHRRNDIGEVLIWPMVARKKKEPIDNWFEAPFEPGKQNGQDDQQEGQTEAEEVLAARIARMIKKWVGRQKLPGRDRAIRYGDILILVRNRDRFAKAMIRRLKAEGLNSAGADRLRLGEHIIVHDLLALSRFVQLQLDDLELANLLKSPIFDFDEDAVFYLCAGRGNGTLFEAMKQSHAQINDQDEQINAQDENMAINLKNDFGEKLRAALDFLDDAIASAAVGSVFEFFSTLFARHGLRARYLARFGNEAEDIIDAFLSSTIDYDARIGLGLTGFDAWLAGADLELKREIDVKSDEIRVITTHSAKGLEAPIVFLVDTGGPAYSNRHAPKLVELEYADSSSVFLWQPKVSQRINASKAAFEKIKTEAEEEYRRLLYVGMTRAADRLIVCGMGNEAVAGHEGKHDHWHKMIFTGLASAGTARQEAAHRRQPGELVDQIDDDGHKFWRWQLSGRKAAEKSMRVDEALQPENMQPALPLWALSRIASQRPPPRPLNPSGVLRFFGFDTVLSEPLSSPGVQKAQNALARGNAVHQLLQLLPEIDAAQHEAVAKIYFTQINNSFSSEQSQAIINEVMQVLNTPQLAQLFGTGSRGEVALAGSVSIAGKKFDIHGQIDRLVVKPDEIILADFKTGKNVPEKPGDIAEDILAQLALYRHLVNNAFGHDKIPPVRTLVIWVCAGQAPKIMEISDDFLDTVFSRLSKTPGENQKTDGHGNRGA